MEQIAIVPGTFDPITLGHIDIIKRASQLFSKVIVAVAESKKKGPTLDIDTRLQLARGAVAEAGLTNVEVKPFDCMLVEFAKNNGAHVIVKGLRTTTDFEYEFQQGSLNHQLYPELENLYIMSNPEYMYYSSSIVRELLSLGYDVWQFVPHNVYEYYQKNKAEK